MFPNPVEETLQLSLQGFSSQELQISVMDATGKKLFTQDYEINSDMDIWEINARHFPSGVYLVAVTHKDGRFVEKFSKL